MHLSPARLRGGLLAVLLLAAACGDELADTPAAPAAASVATLAPAGFVATTSVSIASPDSFDLVAVVDTIDNFIIEDSTGAYVVPTAAQIADVLIGVDSVLAGNVAFADSLLGRYDYDVYSFVSSASGDPLVIFRERRAPGGDVRRGWGTYVYNPSPTARRADVHVNHPISDQHTEDIGADLFQDCRCRWLFIAGAERDANHADPDLQSDMARATNSVFHQLFVHVAAADVRTVSVHGFRHANRENRGLPAGVDQVLSVGGRFFGDDDQVYGAAEDALLARLVAQGFGAGLFNRTPGYTVLGATVNPQGQHANLNFGFGRWLSVETERNVRDSAVLWNDMNAVLTQWIADFPA